MNLHQCHTHHIYSDSSHVSLNKKYAYSVNKLISNWIDDLTLNQALSNFFQQWSPKSHANCGFSALSLATPNSTYSSPPSPSPSPPPSPSPWPSPSLQRSLQQRQLRQLPVQTPTHESLKLHWKHHWEDCMKDRMKNRMEKNFTNCMLVWPWGWIYGKRYMLWAHATLKYARRERIFEIIVAEASSERERNNVTIRTLTTLISLTWYHMLYHRSSTRRLWRLASSYLSF